MISQSRKLRKLTSPSRVPLPTPTRKNLLVGARVCISGEREGILRYYGHTEFAEGLWCGVELFDASGKNDGQVAGVRYFFCAENHGVFAASHKVTAVDDAAHVTLECSRFSGPSVDAVAHDSNVGDISADSSDVLENSSAILNRLTFTTSDSSACLSAEKPRCLSPANNSHRLSACDRTFDLSARCDAARTHDTTFDVGMSAPRQLNYTYDQELPVMDISQLPTEAMSGDSLLALSGLDMSFGLGDSASNPLPADNLETVRELVPHSTPSGESRIQRSGFTMSTPQQDAVPEFGEGDFLCFNEEEMARETARILEALREAQGECEGGCAAPALPEESQSMDSMLNLNGVSNLFEVSSSNVFQHESVCTDALNDTQTMEFGKDNTQTIEYPMNSTHSLDCAPNSTRTLDCAPNSTQTLDYAPDNTQTLDYAPDNTQTLDCSPNNTQTLDCGPDDTQTLDCGPNSTQTLDYAPDSTQTLDKGLNTTCTLPENFGNQSSQSEANVTQTDELRAVDPQLSSSRTVESHANTTQTLAAAEEPQLNNTQVIQSPVAGLHEEGNRLVDVNSVSDMMKMSVDESSTSKAESSMALSTDSVVIAGELPADNIATTHSTKVKPATNENAICNESGQSQSLSQFNSTTSMQVDEAVESGKGKKQPMTKKEKDGVHVKSSIPDRRRTLAAPTANKPLVFSKRRETLLPSVAGKTREKEKTLAKPEVSPKVIQKSKPKSKWADISKQIEQSAKTPKAPAKPIQSKLSAAEPEPAPTCIPAATLRKPVERTTSISSDISQNSQTSAGSSKKHLKRHTLVAPISTSQKPEFKKPRASLLPPPPSKTAGPKAKVKAGEGKLRTPKVIPPAATNSTNSTSQHSDGPPPDVVSSNSPACKPSASTSSKTARKASPNQLNTKSEVVRLQSELADALKAVDCKSRYADGLKEELVAASQAVEGLGVVVQRLTQVIEAKEQELVTSQEASMQLSQSHQQQLAACQNETELLTKNHEDEKRAVVARLMEEREKEMARLALDNERMREELSRACANDMEKLVKEREEEKTTLIEEIGHLKAECASWKVRFAEATQALHKDSDHKLQVAMQPYITLPQEIESLKAVLELKSAEVKELRSENNVYKQKVKTIPDLEKKLYDTEQRLENVQATLDIVSSKERETADKYHKITRKAVQEKKELHRLSLNVEALELKLEEVEFTNSMHQAPDSNACELDESSASLPAYGLENPDMSPSQFTRSFTRSSVKRRSQRGSTNNNTIEIPEHSAC